MIAGHDPQQAVRRPIDVAWMAAAVLVPTVLAMRAQLITVDLAYHLRLGGQILTSGSIPRTDTFTFTMAGSPWIDQQWGAQIVLELVHRVGGWPLLVVFRALLVGITFGLVLAACRARGASARTSGLLTVASFAMAGSALALRPQLLALPLVCLALWLLVTHDRGCRRLLALPLVAWVCATVHGAFVVIVILAVVATITAWLDRSPHRTMVTAAAATTVVMTFLTPLGGELWTSAFGSATDPALRELVTEWQRTTLGDAEGWFLLVSVIGIAVLAVRTPRAWRHLVWLVPFVALAVGARRGLLWWAVVAPVVAAAFLPSRTRARPVDEHESWIPAGVLIGALVAAVVMVAPWDADPPESLLRGAPPGLADAIESELPDGARVFAYQPWASWLEYAAPGALQFVDSRFLLTDEILDDYQVVDAGDPRWPDVMRRWQVDAVAAPAAWPVVERLRSDAEWTVAHDDGRSVLFVHDG